MKGGLISLAAATVGLTNEAAQHLEVRVAYMLLYHVRVNHVCLFVMGYASYGCTWNLAYIL